MRENFLLRASTITAKSIERLLGVRRPGAALALIKREDSKEQLKLLCAFAFFAPLREKTSLMREVDKSTDPLFNSFLVSGCCGDHVL